MDMFGPQDDLVLTLALNHYGRGVQEQIAVGEVGEFLTLVGKRAQGRDTQEQWVDEIADVLVTFRSMANLYGIEAVKDRIRFKIQRLSDRIAAEQIGGQP